MGINAGKRIGTQETLKKLAQQQKVEEPSAVIPIKSEEANRWIEHVNSFPLTAFWNSNWQISIGGQFISMNDQSITLKIDDEKRL